MGTDFRASEIFEIALKIEEHGEKFYNHAAATIAKTNELKSLFEFLAAEEVNHRKIFSGMLSKIEQYQPPESFPGEYFEYLGAYAENLIFSDDEFDAAMKKITGPEDAIEFAMQRELQSVLYYLEMKNLVPAGPQQADIDKIVDEERRHYLKLSEIRKTR
jgi:rubrerythrin